MHWHQQVILALLFCQASHERRIYSLPKLQKSRHCVTISRPACLGVYFMQLNGYGASNYIKQQYDFKLVLKEMIRSGAFIWYYRFFTASSSSD